MSAKVYISGAITTARKSSEIVSFYEALASVCENIGLRAYVPHRQTDPVKTPDVTPRDVYKTTKHVLNTSDLVIAYVGTPSSGVGMELAYAATIDIPIILLYESGQRISRLVRGIPTIIFEIHFTDYDNALAQLKTVLYQWQLGNACV